ncbi:MAG: amino acid permease [Candidatus Melainabacteria bacterium]|nr:MAG: amino acid permease [Candidatus Melainabacteria bacterium]
MNDLFSRLTATLPHQVSNAGSEFIHQERHLGWLLLALLGIGATIGAGIFVMPGRIASLAGPAGIISIAVTSIYFCAVGNRYERFSSFLPTGVSAYSYSYHTLGELVAWVVGWGLFIEYFMGTAAVAIGFSEYLRTAFTFGLPEFWTGWSKSGRFGIDIIAVACILTVTTLLVVAGTRKPAWINAVMVVLKLALLTLFIGAGATSVDSENWRPFLPVGWSGVMQGAALFVFPFVGFDALYTFARESKSLRDTKIATFVCVIGVAVLYLLVFLVLTGLAPSFSASATGVMIPNSLFSGDESAAPLAKVLIASGHGFVARMIAIGAVIGLFNVVFVMIQGAPRIFRNMAEDGMLPQKFEDLKFGIIVTGVICAIFAAVVPFAEISEMMVLGTLVAFLAVGLGSLRLPGSTWVDYLSAFVVATCSVVLIFYLNPMVRQVYLVSCPLGLLIYFSYGYRHSRLRNESA